MEILFPDRFSTRRSIPYHTAFYNMHRYRGIWEGADSHTPPLGKLFIKFTNFKIPENRLRAPSPPPPPTPPGPSTPPFLDPRRNMYYIKLWRMTWNKNEILNMIKYFKIMSYQNCVKSQRRRARTLNSNLEPRTDNQVWNYHNYIWFKSLKMQKKMWYIIYAWYMTFFLFKSRSTWDIREKTTRNEVDSGT